LQYNKEEVDMPQDQVQRWWMAILECGSREEAVARFRARYGREPEVVKPPGDMPWWILGPVPNDGVVQPG